MNIKKKRERGVDGTAVLLQRSMRWLLFAVLFGGGCMLVGCQPTPNAPTQEIIQTVTGTASPTDFGSQDVTKSTQDITEMTEATMTSTEPMEYKLSADYIGSQKYVGQYVTASDFHIVVEWTDGTIVENPSGWETEVWKSLPAGEQKLQIRYHDLVTSVTLFVENTTANGASPCGIDLASDAVLDGQSIVQEALKYMKVPIRQNGLATPYEGHEAMTAAFVQEVYGAFGFALPYELTSQKQFGTAIPSSELRIGDLVFVTKEELAGIYLGGDWALVSDETGLTDFYWVGDAECRRLFQNTCELRSEECFNILIRAFQNNKEYGTWVASYIDDVPFIIGRIRRFTFTVNLLEYADGYYDTYFSYDNFKLPEIFVKRWQKQFLSQKELCEVMRNGEYVRYDHEGNEYFKIDVTPEVWATLTPGIRGEYWNLPFAVEN